MRHFGEAIDRDHKYTPRPGAYVLLPHGRELLVTSQNGEFQLPGGGIDPGENPLQALHREVMEETGWAIARPQKFGAFRRFCFMPEYELWAEKICNIYVAKPIIQRVPPSERGHEAVWIPLHMAATLLDVDGDRYYANILANRGQYIQS